MNDRPQTPPPPAPQPFMRNLLIWVGIALLAGTLFSALRGEEGKGPVHPEIDYTAFVSEARGGDVTDVTLTGNKVTGTREDGTRFIAMVPPGENIMDRLDGTQTQVKVVAPADPTSGLMGLFLSSLPALLIAGIWIYILRQQMKGGQGGGGGMGPFSFGKSRARMLDQAKEKKTFADVAGVDEAKGELEEIVDFLKDPGKFQKLGGKIPKGALLVGPPGTGKTLIARAVAGEANVPFFSISGSDFVEMFVGVGASRVRDMFEQAKKHAPCIIFIDEIDAVGRHRGAGLGGGNDEREQTLNQLLVEMDGFEANEGIILIAATNRPDVLDPALLRPGRFDRQIVVPNPDVKGREKILSVHAEKVPLAKNVNLSVIARGTPGFSGADLANLINEAALLAARNNKRVVSMEELEGAKDKVMMGSERRSLAMSEEEKTLTAYHEAGHAIVAFAEPASDPVHKATIVPRGRALGLVMRLPPGDRLSIARDKLYADLAVAMGGRVAEELIFGPDKVTTGASSDIRMATDMARRMVTEWGYSEKLGMVHYGTDQQEVFLGHSMQQAKNMSDETAALIDSEIRKLVEYGLTKARKILTDQIADLHMLAKALLEYETLSGDEIKDMLAGKLIRQDEPPSDLPQKPRGSVPTTRKSSDNGPVGEPQPA